MTKAVNIAERPHTLFTLLGNENYIDNLLATGICKTQNPFISKIDKGVGMMRVNFDSISEIVYDDIILNTIIKR